MVSALCAVRTFFNLLFLQYNMVIPWNFFHLLIWLCVKAATVLRNDLCKVIVWKVFVMSKLIECELINLYLFSLLSQGFQILPSFLT